MSALLRQLGYFAAAGVACFYVFLVLRAPTGVPTMNEKRQQILRMEKDNDALRQEIEKANGRIQEYESSSDARDQAVHENTNKVRERETVIYLPEGGTDASTPPTKQ